MQLLSGQLVLSATDLSNHLGCRHLTSVDLRVAQRLLDPPQVHDPARDALRARGEEHETRYLDSLRAQGLSVENLTTLRGAPAVEATLQTMRAGVDVIAQGTLSRAAGPAAQMSSDGWKQPRARSEPGPTRSSTPSSPSTVDFAATSSPRVDPDHAGADSPRPAE